MKTQQRQNKLKSLFLLDGLGAFISAIALGIIMPNLVDLFGMPPSVLYWLALIAIIFSTYSLSCYLTKVRNLKLCLQVIAIANLIYCLITAALVVHYYPKVTVLGLAYFIFEMAVIITLSIVELRNTFK